MCDAWGREWSELRMTGYRVAAVHEAYVSLLPTLPFNSQ